MARILAFDFGTIRIGIATTDPLQIIATSLDTVPNREIFEYVKAYLLREEVEAFVVGEPKQLDGDDAKIMPLVRSFADKLRELFPAIPVHWQDERFSSFEAKKIIVQSGISKKKRRDKSLLDKISAAIILQEFMERKRGG